jgi:hypothetical protein
MKFHISLWKNEELYLILGVAVKLHSHCHASMLLAGIQSGFDTMATGLINY